MGYQVRYSIPTTHLSTDLFSRSVHKTYPEKYTIYREVENTRKISQMFDNLKRKEYGEIKDAKNIGSYNDFEL
jgi:hypothetical protein